MTAPYAIGTCTSCAKGPRRLDVETGACNACLTRHRNLVEFFRLAREDAGFKSYARRNLSQRTSETFDAIFVGKPRLGVGDDDRRVDRAR